MPFPGYPNLPDDELAGAVTHFAGLLKPNPQEMTQFAPLVEIGQAELQRRMMQSLKGSIDSFRVSTTDATQTLNNAISDLQKSSERAASRIMWLTVGLVALTLALFGATLALIFS